MHYENNNTQNETELCPVLCTIICFGTGYFIGSNINNVSLFCILLYASIFVIITLFIIYILYRLFLKKRCSES